MALNSEDNNVKKSLKYRGYPLLRKDDEIYFGNMTDDYVVRMQILHKKIVNGLEVADKIAVYKVSTNESLNVMEAIIRKSEKYSLYDALDLAVAWLNRKE
jgi:hypothetical protein